MAVYEPGIVVKNCTNDRLLVIYADYRLAETNSYLAQLNFVDITEHIYQQHERQGP